MDFETFKAIELAIPLWQVLLYTGLVIILMLFGHCRLGITIFLCFILYWIFIHNHATLSQIFGNSTTFMGVYLVCGTILVFLILISFFLKE
ncbi:MAG: hypothetical protein A2042_07720 [Candidatus Schekmanbacteria bacterium GWA2_38_11]|uniref:Uncharacterized protein n=1 Tax=Candidatus Schekmanbacteria bacterium GWA2_38_11 TaxID=1817876 RepID=A0A1F7RCA1_9BACT|nr:MAG: hypothetical protein A2042_07720 [Candidatus Schekmanbacteria bacterium GWA2_38_11]